MIQDGMKKAQPWENHLLWRYKQRPLKHTYKDAREIGQGHGKDYPRKKEKVEVLEEGSSQRYPFYW